MSSLTQTHTAVNNNNDIFPKAVGILLGLLRVNQSSSYMMLERDRPWIRGEVIALLVKCMDKLHKSFYIKGCSFRKQDVNQLVINFYAVEKKRDLFLILKSYKVNIRDL